MRQGDLSRLESGHHDPRLSTLIKLATALDMEVMLVPKELAVRFAPPEAAADDQTPLQRYAREDEE